MKFSSVLSAVRTPVGRFGGLLSNHTAAQLAGLAIKEALVRAGLQPDLVDLTIVGHARQAANGPNPARQAALAAGIPDEKPSWTLNQACASGLAAIDHAHKALLLGDAEIVVAAGMECMSRVPYYLENARWGLRLGHDQLVDGMYKDGFFCPMSDMVMGETVELLADEFEISRQEQDEFAAASQQKCEAARKAGKFTDEIVGVEVKEKRQKVVMATDEHPRDGVTAAGLQRLSPVYKLAHREGTVTAGNASGITDGASALILTTADKARELGLEEMARYTGGVVAGCAPRRMGLGPVHALSALERKFGRQAGDFDIVEINEAFAAQVIACQRTLQIPADKLNINGGSIAMGHPIGCTGNRIAVSLLHELRRRGGGRGLVTLCVSGGFGIAGMFETA
ncbi:MAG: thiolase family protein [Vulcanimicrobiota bacterium]